MKRVYQQMDPFLFSCIYPKTFLDKHFNKLKNQGDLLKHYHFFKKDSKLWLENNFELSNKILKQKGSGYIDLNYFSFSQIANRLLCLPPNSD